MAKPVNEEDQRKVLETSALGYEHQEINKTLEMLRKTRKARGGAGAPLQVPVHLRDAAAGKPILVTDADLSPNTPRKSREQVMDEATQLAREINEAEEEQR